MTRYFVDTNVFLRTLIREDEKAFKDCRNFLTAIKNNKIDGITSNFVLTEIVWTLASYYNFPKKNIVRAIESIINLSGLKIVNGCDIKYALALYKKKSVKFVDALLASIEELKNKEWVIVSYDKDFDKLGVVRKEPDTLV